MGITVAAGEEVHALLAAFYKHTDEAMLISQFEAGEAHLCFFIDANPAACKMLGYEKEELLAMPPDVVLFSSVGSKIIKFIKERLIQTRQASHEIELRTKGGGSELVEIKSSLVEIEEKKYVLHTIKNIENKKVVQDQWQADTNAALELLDAVQAYIIILDRDGVIVSWNRYCEEKTGYLSDEVKGMRIWDLLIDKGEQDSFKNICCRGVGSLSTYESCWMAKDGKRLHIQWSATVLQGGCSEKEFIIGSGIDISTRKDYERSLLASTQKYRSLVENNPDGIILFSDDRKCLLNKEARRIFGFEAEVMERSEFLQKILPADKEKAIAYFKGLTDDQDTKESIVLEIRRNVSSTIIIEAKGITKRINDVDYIHIVLRDVTMQKLAEKQLLQLNARMENVLDSTDEMIIGLDNDYHITFVNKSLAKLTGKAAEELAGMHCQQVFDLLENIVEGKERSILDELISGGNTKEIMIDTNGKTKYFEVKLMPIGHGEGALLTMYDITDRILLEKRLEGYYEAIASGVTVQDKDGRFIYFNRNAQEILGYSKDDLISQGSQNSRWELFDENGDDLPIEEHPWRKAISTKEEIKNFVLGFYHPAKQEIRWILANTRNVSMAEEDSVELVVSTFHDITAKVRMDKRMKEREKLALVGQLAAGVAHEVKNPLTSILGFMKLMRHDTIVKQEYIDIILDELENINLVTSEFLALAEPQPVKMEMMCLHEDVLQPVVKSLKSQLVKSGSRIKWNMDTVSQPVSGVREQLKLLFLHIFKNSLEAMPEGGNIDLSVIHENRTMVVRVKDDGVGIAPDRLKHLGEPFYSIKEKGTGLGLLLCKKIAHEHRGNIVIKSVQGIGTIVEVSLPVSARRMDSLPE